MIPSCSQLCAVPLRAARRGAEVAAHPNSFSHVTLQRVLILDYDKKTVTASDLYILKYSKGMLGNAFII